MTTRGGRVARLSSRYSPFAELPRPLRVVLVLAIVGGLAQRVIWALGRRHFFATDEAGNVAAAIANGHGFADPFFVGQGPTAHLLPVMPAFVSLIYAVFGTRTVPAELVLLGFAMAFTFACYVLSAIAAALVGVPRRACYWAFVALCVLPAYTSVEALKWRVWEGGLGLFMALATLVLLLRVERGDAPRGFGWFQAVLPAATFFIQPVLGIAAFAAWALFVWRHRASRGLARPASAAALALALLIAPWAARNAAAMGEPFLLRDNLGMELAVADYDGAVAPANRKDAFIARLAAIQPYDHPAVQRAMAAAGGEVAYSRRLGAETKAWIRAHPDRFAVLLGRHFREMLFTDRWMFKEGKNKIMSAARATTVAIVAVLALIGLAPGLARREPLWLYAAAYLWLPVLLYLPFQPVVRYSWLIWPTLVPLAAAAIASALRRDPRPRRMPAEMTMADAPA